MSITELEQRCNELRQDLKAWEKQFAAQNEGRRAGREDIKANAEISQKYKEYNKLRGRLSGKPEPSTPSKRAPRPKSHHDVDRTPKAAPKPPTFTPIKRKRDEEDAPENVDPTTEDVDASPEGPAFIGPTPQRNGIVLGLFDMLPNGTPSKSRTILGDAEPNVLQTPSKESDTSIEPRARGERTPQSSGKRFLLDRFVTPKKRKLNDQGTPSTIRGLATPAFLRRDNMLGAIEEDDEPAPRPMPWKRNGMVRSLSSMIQAMKKDEDDRLDDEADIMREMEMEEQGISIPKKLKAPKIQVENSQFDMPLGPDRGIESDEDSEEEPELGPDGKPRRAWKKKGLKRQTRRVIMRPNIAKPKPEPILQNQEESGDEAATVPETQVQAEEAADDNDSDDGSVYASDASHTPKTRKVPVKKKAEEPTEKRKEGIVKKAARKIKATANANYRRLNIKGKAATSGAKGKFSRRR
ncbi:DNA replication regulator sld2 [Plenodomus lindquistii]|nr:DNA replication regulator sld2 [Plenodomus lindquistii]